MNFNGVREALQSGEGRRTIGLNRRRGESLAKRSTVRAARAPAEAAPPLWRMSTWRMFGGKSKAARITDEETAELEEATARLKSLISRKSLIAAGFRINGRVSGLKVVANPDQKDADRPERNFLLEWLDERVGVINPMGTFRLTWDMGTSYLLMICLILTPYQLCFMRTQLGPFESVELVNLIIDLVFLADFLLTFNTAIMEHGELVTSRKQIAANYARGWAWIDFTTSIPSAHIMSAFQTSARQAVATRLTRLIRILKFSRLLKMFKLLKYFDSMNQWDDDPSRQVVSDSMHFFNLVLIVVFLAHFSACAFVFTAREPRPTAARRARTRRSSRRRQTAGRRTAGPRRRGSRGTSTRGGGCGAATTCRTFLTRPAASIRGGVGGRGATSRRRGASTSCPCTGP